MDEGISMHHAVSFKLGMLKAGYQGEDPFCSAM
jgi:hypothetical protein